LDLPVTEID